MNNFDKECTAVTTSFFYSHLCNYATNTKMHTFRQLALTTSLRPDQIVELITSQATICLCDNTISELYFSNKRTAPNELIVAPSSKRRRVKNTSTFASASESASPNPNASTASSAYCGSFRILLDWYSDNIILSPEILPTPSCSTCGHTFDVSIDFSVTDYSVHFCVNKATDLFSAWKDLAEPPVTVQTPREQWRTRDDLLFDTLGKLYKKGKVELRRPRLVLTFGHGGTPQFHADFEMHALLPAKDWALRDLLSLLFSPPPFDNVTGDMDVTMFYSALQPPVSSCIPVGAQPNELEPTLMPFQAQAVLWMLNREGMTLNKDGKLVPHVHNHARDLPLVWSKVHTDKGTELLVNRHTGEVLTEAPQSFEEEFEDEDGVLGGILSEEMGLGKTVEMLALILHHRPTDPVTEPSFVTEHNKNLRATGATLIITPNAILSQWVSEIKTHAPSLRYFVYDGASSKSGRDITVEDLLAYDIVLTTYPILSKEVYYARKLLDRPRRTTQKYLPRRSPLVKILWWRVLLDEAQMIESTVTKTAEMALLIPRVHPWAVTGTPIKTNFHDLHGLFAFLRLEPLASTPYLLPMLLSPVSRAALLAFCRRVVYRNSKQAVRAQLDIPPQHRQVVHVSFSRIELHYYEELFEQCCLEIDLDWLDEQGWTLPGVDEVETYAERDKLRDRMEVARGKMRAWLLRLRQTCCHPGIGAQNQKQLGGTLHTVTEVLAVMYRQCISKILTLDHQLANTKFRGAALMELQEQFEPALRMYEVGLKFVQQKVAETRDRLAGKKGKRALKRAEGGADVDVEGARKRRGREDDDGGVEGEKEDDDGGVEDDRVGRIDEAGDDVESLSVGLHHWLEAEHKFLFFIASVNHQLERTEKETEFYELAEGLRRELLRPMEKKFDAALREIAPKIMTVKTADFSYSTLTGGILSWDIIERADDFAERLNGQRHIVDTWRGKIFDTLTAKLVDQDADPDGEEYQGSLELQESGAAYQEAYSKLLADRRYIITGIWNALYLGDDFWGPVVKKKNRAGLEKELEDQREEFSPKKNTEPHLKDLVLELRQALQRLYITEKEEHIIDAELARIGRDVDAQTRVLSVLEKCEDFRKLYNIRIEYYRQLQAISDQVRVVESKNPEREGKAIQTQEADLERQMATQTSRRRYLEHLVEMNSKGVEEMDEEERMCLICRNDFIQGAITVWWP
ncbi:SNF2 family N-terminal domain-containing protein [Jimgerdemannia flammicorona]|uniref:SNF2 family N-terminal domain-containing protein n=1 Tax=Jimgerdemannia flammicorona TaxID=994334 RepID=A0A433DIM5_9FUNG|nr:SNF2 family N-terminal domain-containing protein [Jimgerdemannia flammicorona]